MSVSGLDMVLQIYLLVLVSYVVIQFLRIVVMIVCEIVIDKLERSGRDPFPVDPETTWDIWRRL